MHETTTRSIFEIASLLDQAVQAAAPAADVAQRFLAAFSAALSDVQLADARVYSLRAGTLHLEAAVGSQAEAQPDALMTQVLQDQKITREGLRWLAPLTCDNQLDGLLEVVLEAEPASGFEAWLGTAALLLSNARTQLFVDDLAARQGRVMAQLNAAHTFREMAAAVAEHMLKAPKQFVAISVLEYDQDGQPIGFSTIATANSRNSYETNTRYTFPHSIPPALREVFTQAVPLSIYDVDNDERVDARYRAWTETLHIRAMCLLPMRSEGRVFGILSVNHSESPGELSERERNAYQLLADHISALVRVHHLIGETLSSQGQVERALELVQAQYETTSQVYAAETTAEMLAAIYEFTGRAYASGHLGLVEGAKLRIVAEVDAEGARETDQLVDLKDYPAYDTLTGVESLAVENIHNARLLSDAEKTRLADKGVVALILLPLLNERRLSGIIMLEHPTPQALPSERLRALRSIADQLSVKFDNQRLLRSMTQSLEEVRTLYETNRALLNAQDVLDVLRALRDHLAPDALSIVQMHVERGSEGQAEDLRLRYRIIGSEEQVLDMSVKGLMSPTALLEASRIWDKPDYRVAFTEDVDKDYLSGLMKPLLEQRGTRSFISLILHNSIGAQDIISVSFGEPRQFNEGTRRLYAAVRDQVEVVLQVQQLYFDTQVSASQLADQVRVLEAINRLTSSLTTQRDEAALLDELCRTLVDALGINHASALLLDETEVTALVISEYPEGDLRGKRIEVRDDSLHQKARLERRPVIINDVETEGELSDATRAGLQQLGIKSLLVVPMIDLQDNTIGSIGLDMYTPRLFTQEIVDVAQTMTQQATVSLQNVRFLNDAQRRAEQLGHITAFSQSVQATLETEAILKIAIDECSRMMPMDYIGISLYDPLAGAMRLVARAQDGAVEVHLDNATQLEMSGTAAGEAWKTRRLVHIPDISVERLMRYTHPFTTGSLMVAPVFSRGMSRGTVEVAVRTPYAYKIADTAVFQQFVTQLAVALENSEAFEESQRLAQNKALANEIAAQLQRQPGLDGMMNLTVKELGRALGARRARIRLNVETMRSEE